MIHTRIQDMHCYPDDNALEAIRSAINEKYCWRTCGRAMSKRSCCFIGVTALSILTICLLTFYNDLDIRKTLLRSYTDYMEDDDVSGRYVRARTYQETGMKTILLWNTLFGDRNFYFGEGDVFHDCPVNKCKIFNYRNHLNVEDYDAILFHGNELSEYEMPERRRTRQLYVYVNLESPANWAIPRKYDKEYFNLTMTYRLDSDVPWTYGIIEDVKSGEFVAPSRNADWSTLRNSTSAEETVDEMPFAILDVIRGKRKLVTWFVSNCKAKSGRLEYVEELSKHIGVDVYGKCGAFSCSRSQDCFDDVVEPNYFFYLSFENSFCNDYVTEKLMNPLWYNVVPVVYGGANYTQFVPPNSYVNALDFESPKELAAYLKYLSQDLRQYQSFLQWKKYYRVNRGTKRAVCTLCEVLHKQKEPAVYSILSDWYTKDKCPIQTLLRNSGNKYATKITLRNRT